MRKEVEEYAIRFGKNLLGYRGIDSEGNYYLLIIKDGKVENKIPLDRLINSFFVPDRLWYRIPQ